jgi:hypothetical protein
LKADAQAEAGQTRQLMSYIKSSKDGKNSRPQLLIRRLWSALETVEGRRLTSQEMSRCLNLSDSAWSEWILGKTELNQIEAFLRLCERLGHSGCVELLRPHLRVFPTLRSPELAHDPASVDILRTLLRKPAGMTFIVGGSETQRTFLFTAFGHSYLGADTACHSLAGWDTHVATWFVPVPGLFYQHDGRCEPLKLRLEALQHSLILSNGLWKRSQEHRTNLVQCALSCHVIVADGLDLQGLRLQLHGKRIPVDVVEVAGDAPRLHVVVTNLAEAAFSGFKRQ